MPTFHARHGDIYFEQRGARADPRVLLIHGLGCQLVQWPDSLIDGIAGAGFCVVMLDNRDAGLSHESSAAPPAIEAIVAAANGEPALAPAYTLADMAQDAVELLDHLGQAGAHVVGLSMGGMIAQHVATSHAERAFSLTSIMSSTGNPDLPRRDEALMAFLQPLAADDTEAAIEAQTRAFQAIGSEHYDSAEVGFARFSRRAVERSFRPAGLMRQLGAIVADGDRREDLAAIRTPTLVIHGVDDPLVPVEAGRDTAKAINGAQIVEIERMGHDLPEPEIPRVVEAIVEHARSVELLR